MPSTEQGVGLVSVLPHGLLAFVVSPMNYASQQAEIDPSYTVHTPGVL